ncbi:hypothetical protein ACFVS7_19560 [Streptomyces rubiginosohelvolus]|uniref:hypothetical protein n=1 Tax=Streptomyces rubiginosohelvolus TaxID=67362 RepID=UPI0036D7E9DE
MGGLLSELGKQLAERWMSLLVLPGAMFLAAVLTARTLGHAAPFDFDHLVREVQTWHPASGEGTGARLVVLLLLFALLAAATGVVAQTLGSLVERLWFAADWASWPRPLRTIAGWRVTRRRRRRIRARTAYENERQRVGALLAAGAPGEGPDLSSLRLAVSRISQEDPHRPTWSGDRMHAMALRLDRDLDLDLAAVWPALWQLLPDAPRQQIESAREVLSRATTLTAWAVMYACLAVWWWPGAVLAAAMFATAWLRTRAATDTYAALVEASVHLYVGELAGHLGVPVTGVPGRRTGWEITCLLQGRRHLIELTAHRPQR